MKVIRISPEGATRHTVEELPVLLKAPEGFVWVDIPECDADAAETLREVFGFHPIAVGNCVERNHMSKVHLYADHVFTVLHAPHIGERGHVHYVELDQFIGANYLVTVHGPLNPKVAPDVAHLDTGLVMRRLERGNLCVGHPYELSYAIVSSMARREIDLVAQLAQESGQLEQGVTTQQTRDDPEAFVEDLFEVWYELLAIRTIAAHSSATYGRIATATQSASHPGHSQVVDIADQFERVASLADGQREFLHGVIEFYKTRAETHTTLAAERMAEISVRQNDDMRKISAWVAIGAVPTALTGFFGQNVPYPGFGSFTGFVISSSLIVAGATLLYVLFRRKQWL